MPYYSGFQSLISESFRFWFKDDVIIENYRPDWLHGMEIDLYIPKYHVGFEVQGQQHYLFVPKWQHSVSDYLAQRKRDELKRSIARKEGVRIFVIQEFDGLYQKLRNNVNGKQFAILPYLLRERIKKYRQNINVAREGWIAFKVKRNEIIPINRASSQYLKEHPELKMS